MFLQPSTPPSATRRARRASRGFTLIELMVVVIIIGVTAALATPTLVGQLRDRRSRDTAQRIAQLYTGARMRALGRGSAVVVQYRPTGFTVLESVEGATAALLRGAQYANCGAQPGLGCLTNNWGAADTSRQVATLNPLSDITVAAFDKSGSSKTQMDICFTPLGRSFISFDGTTPTTAMVGATTFTVQRGPGLLRTVAIMPNGISRLGL